MNQSTSFLLPLLLAPALLAQGGDKLTLTINAKKGETVYLVEKTVMEQSIDMGGQQMDMNNETTQTVALTVTGVNDKGDLSVEVKVLRIQGSMALPMGMGDVEFDSAKPSDDEDEGGFPGMGGIGKAMTALAGKTFQAVVSPQGTVSDMKGVEAALDEARKAAGRMGGQMLGGSLNASAIEQLILSAFGSRPKDPIAVGGEWETKKSENAQRMPLQMTMKMTLAKADADQFEVKVQGTVSTTEGGAKAADGAKEDEDPNAAMAREMMAKMKISNGKIAGSQIVSRKDGFVVKSDSTTSMDMSMPSPMGGGDMSITQKTTRTVTRTTAEAAMPKAAGKGEAKDK